MDELKLPPEVSSQRVDIVELRLFIEELACNICRFTHAAQDGVEPQFVRIKQEVELHPSDAFAEPAYPHHQGWHHHLSSQPVRLCELPIEGALLSEYTDAQDRPQRP